MARSDWDVSKLRVERAGGETWVSYGNEEDYYAKTYYNGGFVARFRSYHRGANGWGQFKKDLLRTHSPESYFAALEAGESPMGAVYPEKGMLHGTTFE